MNAPLSLFLTQFSAVPLAAAEPETFDFVEDLPEPEPEVTLTVADLEAQLAAAAQDARSEAEQRHQAETSDLIAAYEQAQEQALAMARTEWANAASDSLASSLDDAIGGLRTMLAERVANVLRPLISDVIVARAKTELLDAVDRLLADTTQPVLSVRGPEDLGVALRIARPDAPIEWIVAETVEITLVADATTIETKLAAALADIATEI